MDQAPDLESRIHILEEKFRMKYTPPEKPREGDLVLADGENWNPGQGRGFYEYIGGLWKKL